MAHELVVQLQRLGMASVLSLSKADSQLAFLSLVRPSAAVARVLPWACWPCHWPGTLPMADPHPVAGSLQMSRSRAEPSLELPALVTVAPHSLVVVATDTDM